MDAIWSIESVITDEECVTAMVLRNVDPRDLAGNGEQIIVTSRNPATLYRLLDSLHVSDDASDDCC